jgi:hypothetical protein
MILRSGQTVAGQFTTSRADTGAAANADTTPAGTLVLNGVDNAAAVTITNPSTGVYKWSVTLPTLAFGDLVQVRIAATVNSVTGKAIVWRDGKDLSIDASGNYSGSLTAAERTAIAAAVEAAILNEGDGQAVQQAIVNKINATDTNLAGLTLSAIAAAVWDALTSGMTTASSIGKLILDNLNAAITTRPTAAEIETQLSGTHGSGAWGGAASTGTGAFSVIVHVTDGTINLPNARVRVSGGPTAASGFTASTGLITLGLDGGTYTLVVTKGGYTYTPTPQTVAADGTIDVVMTAATTPTTTPTQCTGQLVTKDGQGNLAPGVDVHFGFVSWNGTGGVSFPKESFNGTSDGGGLLQEAFEQNARYWGRRDASNGQEGAKVYFNTPTNNVSFSLPPVLGSPGI